MSTTDSGKRSWDYEGDNWRCCSFCFWFGGIPGGAECVGRGMKQITERDRIAARLLALPIVAW